MYSFLLGHKKASLLLAVWFVSVAAGMGALGLYATTPGLQGEARSEWPADSGIARNLRRSTLLVFLHPHCPCSRATLAEVSRLLGAPSGDLDVHVVFVQPPGAAAGWVKGPLWSDAEALEGVQIHADVDGVEATRFGVKTSGHVLLFDEHGQVRLSGGITPARGHEGDNPGRQAIVGREEIASTPPVTCPVFGCPLSNEEETFEEAAP
jgi:hypothetical protein